MLDKVDQDGDPVRAGIDVDELKEIRKMFFLASSECNHILDAHRTTMECEVVKLVADLYQLRENELYFYLKNGEEETERFFNIKVRDTK